MIHTNDNHRDRLCSNTWRIITSHIGSATIMSIVLVSASLLLPMITMSSQVALAQRLLLPTQQPIFSNNNLLSLQQQQQLQLQRQQAAAQRLLQLSSQPTLSPGINSINNNNNILSALKQVPGTNIIVPSSTSPSGSITTTTPGFPYSSTTTAAAAAAYNTHGGVATIVTGQGAAAGLTPYIPTSNQVPFIQGISTNGFISLPQCASNTGSAILQTPNPDPSALIFQVFSSPSNSINEIPNTRTTISTATTNNNNNVNTATLLPLVGRFTISNSLGVPSIAGQINTGQVSGNTFSLQGTLAGSNTIVANALSGGLSSSSSNLCSSNAFSSNPLFPTTTTSTSTSNTGINDFTITGTCGTNAPVTFAIDRVVVGVYSANISCNNIA
jgi:hypothetical protein